MVRSILKWTDAKMNEVSNGECKHGLAKAAGLGAVEGAIDACTVVGALGLVMAVVSCVTKK